MVGPPNPELWHAGRSAPPRAGGAGGGVRSRPAFASSLVKGGERMSRSQAVRWREIEQPSWAAPQSVTHVRMPPSILETLPWPCPRGGPGTPDDLDAVL